jgi:hypothetical protein
MEVGTPAFMAPEVCLGKVSLHSDQYSLAATYVTARLGRYLFDTRNRREMEDHHLRTPPNLDPLPAAEQKVLLKALAKRPEDRYPNCAAFARALRKAVLEPVAPPTGGRRLFIVLALLAGLVSLVMAGVVVWLLIHPRHDQEPPPPELPWSPAGWEPDAAAGTEVVAGRLFAKKLTRREADEQLVALLVWPTQPTDKGPFYMLENKISNRVFKAVWDRAEKNPASALRRFRDPLIPELRKLLFPGNWSAGARDWNDNPLGSAGEQAGVPVVGVTVPEAMVVARELGGRLPTSTQYLKAVGMSDRDGLARDTAGPAGPAVDDGSPMVRWMEIRRRGLALGLLNNGPWPVGFPTPDRSCFGIHQLASNGAEWTADDFEHGGRLELGTTEPGKDYKVRVVGTNWRLLNVLTFDEMQRPETFNTPVPWVHWDPTQPWEGESVGFRIVLEPPP